MWSEKSAKRDGRRKKKMVPLITLNFSLVFLPRLFKSRACNARNVGNVLSLDPCVTLLLERLWAFFASLHALTQSHGCELAMEIKMIISLFSSTPRHHLSIILCLTRTSSFNEAAIEKYGNKREDIRVVALLRLCIYVLMSIWA